jgi:hypothetical protein
MHPQFPWLTDPKEETLPREPRECFREVPDNMTPGFDSSWTWGPPCGILIGLPSARNTSVMQGFLLLFIAAVSVHDVALVVLNHEVILQFERNPIGRWLIEVNGGSVWLLVGVKLCCTSLVCTVLVGIYSTMRAIGFAVTVGLASFQAWLLLYLTFH